MDMAAIDAFQPGDKAQYGGFAAAGGAKQREKLTIIDGQVEVGNDVFAIKAFTNSFQIAYQRRLNANGFVYSIFVAQSDIDDAQVAAYAAGGVTSLVTRDEGRDNT